MLCVYTCVCLCVCCVDSDLEDDSSHELGVRLLVGQELPDDLVHDVLRREEVVQELGQDPGHHARLAGKALTDPGERRPRVGAEGRE